MTPQIFLHMLETKYLGLIGVAVSDRGLRRLRMFQENKTTFLILNENYQEGEYLFSEKETKSAVEQLKAYLNYEINQFSLPIDWSGYTKFQRDVLKETLSIPYGETRSYGQVAAAIRNPKASRAVGQAEKSNQVPLVVPCHRVLGSDGSLTGYGGKDNTDIKAWLLDFEKIGLN
ncbi:MAG: methylated-DNA--[protein]-cysteine S-methyltransferase, partial [Anaerolineales bacterium]|nr:methylated-DNA--[protein]-cysteine S-methyltransferase [Anaerolineales bacterium]